MTGCGCWFDVWGQLFVLNVTKLETDGEWQSLDLGFVNGVIVLWRDLT